MKGYFYPDAWHAMAALTAELTGASVPVDRRPVVLLR